MGEKKEVTDYPPDAPLPKVKVSVVRAKPVTLSGPTLYVGWKYIAEITNFQELKNWWSARGLGNCEVVTLDQRAFVNGVHDSGDNTDGIAAPETYGTWVTYAAKYYWDPSYSVSYYFAEPLYLFDYYVPFPSELPVGVWTDLQFAVSPPIPEVSWIMIVPLAILGIGALAYWYLKRRK